MKFTKVEHTDFRAWSFSMPDDNHSNIVSCGGANVLVWLRKEGVIQMRMSSTLDRCNRQEELEYPLSAKTFFKAIQPVRKTIMQCLVKFGFVEIA